MSSASDFVIENGVLKKYVGPGGDVIIPDSVTSIGSGAFCNCNSLTSVTIPEGVTSIGVSAFSNCSSLTSVTIPDSVTSIGDRAFENCSNLTRVTIPDNVTDIDRDVFRNCNRLSLIKLSRNVSRIGVHAFHGTAYEAQMMRWEDDILYLDHALLAVTAEPKIKLTVRQGTTVIADEAFIDCSELKLLVSSALPSWKHAPGRAFIVRDPAKASGWYAYTAKSDCDNLSDFAQTGKWSQYDLELLNNGPKYKYKLPARLLGALGRMVDASELTEENRKLYDELLCKNAKKLVPLAEEFEDSAILCDLLSLQILDGKTLKALQKLMAASPVPEIAALAAMELNTAPAVEKEPEAAPASPLQAEYAAKLKAIKGDAVIKKMKLIGNAMPKVNLTDGTEAPEALFRFLLASYGEQLWAEYHFVPEADEAAKLLSYDSLCAAMDNVSGNLDGPSYPAVLPLLCRYGNAQQIRTLTNAWKNWGDWSLFGQKGRKAQVTLADALILSDTREAILWLEKNRNLEGYAKLRGIEAAEVYDKYLFDFGLDENGKRVFDLGCTQIELSLTPELELALYDRAKQKSVKSIPKKGVDPAVQKQAEAELADLRQSLKKAVKLKKDQLYLEFLSGCTDDAENWKKRYSFNPFLREIAKLLVWAQGEHSFIPTDSGLTDSVGQPYHLGDEPVKLAHPMEMKPEGVTAWQKYFTRHGLKQPFLQVWESAIDFAMFRADRYKNVRVNPLYLKSQQKRGISTEWSYGIRSLIVDGFDVQWQVAEWHPDDERQYIEITSLKPQDWNRRANSVIAYMDRITVWERVRKDDVSIMNMIECFTLAQVMEMIQTAQEAQAVNVLALLLEYKNAHFADFDPMDEFTLE